jgi:predicted nucleic acid-binding protein
VIVLDTNVVSEPMRASGGDTTVVQWLDRQDAGSLYLTSVSLAELLLGVAALPAGRRRGTLATALQALMKKLFEGRILSFDQDAAVRFADLLAKTRTKGSAVSFADGQIAAIASCHGFAVATRDRQPFEACGVRVIDPWHP